MKRKNGHQDRKRTKPGFVWLIGAGPGDPDLMTLRARRALDDAKVILYDDLVNPSVLPPPYHWRTFIPVGKRGSRGTPQVSIEKLMIRYARQGHTVVRLKGGDPFVLGRGAEEVAALRAARVPYEVIPGVSSATGVPTLAGIPLTHRGVAASFTVVTGHLAEGKDDREPEWDLLAHSTDTLVIMMGVATFKAIAARLIKAGKPPHTPVAVIRWGSWPMEHRQIGTLADGAAGKMPVGTPSVIVIGDVVRQAVRSPGVRGRLAGVRIAITRPAQWKDPLAAGLAAHGALVLETPAIHRVSGTFLWNGAERKRVESILRRIASYDWIVFTSAEAAADLDWTRQVLNLNRRDFLTPRIAAIGPGTGGAVTYAFCPPDVIATDHSQEGMLRALGSVRGMRILIPRARVAREVLPSGLRRAGATVDVLPMYDTQPDPGGLRRLADLMRSGELDAVTFTSGSTVQHTLAAIGRTGRRQLANRSILAASIGPVTSAELRKHGIRVPIQSTQATMDGLVSAIARYYSRHPHAPRLR